MNIMKLFVGAVALSVSVVAQADVAVIVNSLNTQPVSESEVQQIFLGKRKDFADGTEATPYNLPKGAANRDTFNEVVLGKNPSRYEAYWAKLIFTGKGRPPAELDTDAAVIAAVGGDIGAIGYVDAESVNSSARVVMNSSVRVILEVPTGK